MSGATCLVIYGILLAILNSLVKVLAGIPVYQIVLVRSVVTFAATYGALRLAGIPPFGNNKPMLILRGLTGTLYVVLFYGAIQALPLASAVALHYTFPILTLIFAAIFLKERPTPLQWLLILVAFAGVVMIRGFDPRVTMTGVALALLSAVAVAGTVTVIRALRDQEHTLVVMLYFPLMGLILIGPLAATHWVHPTLRQWGVLLLTGLLTQVVQYFLTLAYTKDSPANIGNLNYLTIVYSLVIGGVGFGEYMPPLALGGMAVIVTAAILSSKVKKRAT